MGKKFSTKITGGATSIEMAAGFEFIDELNMFRAFFQIKPPSEVTRRFDRAKDVKIEIRPTMLEYEDGSHTGMNIHGTIDQRCIVEQFRGRPFRAYYNPRSMKNRGWIEIDLEED